MSREITLASQALTVSSRAASCSSASPSLLEPDDIDILLHPACGLQALVIRQLAAGQLFPFNPGTLTSIYSCVLRRQAFGAGELVSGWKSLAISCGTHRCLSVFFAGSSS